MTPETEEPTEVPTEAPSEPAEDPTESPDGQTTEGPATETPAETEAPKGGCKSSVGMGAAAVVTAMAAYAALKKKD